MDDICVGDYVRTKQGYIARIEEIDNEFIWCDDTVHNDYGEESPLLPIDLERLDGTHLRAIDYITKHSKNIIDLIEVGDYVNGWEVQEKYKMDTEEWCVSECCGDSYYDCYAYNKDIKTVLTKEQFSSMQYIVKED